MKNKRTAKEEEMTITLHNIPPRDEAHRQDIIRVIDGVFETIFEKIIEERNKKNDDTDDTIPLIK